MAFLKCIKRSIPYQVREPLPGTSVYNPLEDSAQVTDAVHPLIIKGVLGEEWCISRERFNKTYYVPDGLVMPEYKMCWPKVEGQIPKFCTLRPIEQGPFTIRTPGGVVLTGNRRGIDHGWGDIIMADNDNGEPSKESRWVVNGVVFFATYEIVAGVEVLRDV